MIFQRNKMPAVSIFNNNPAPNSALNTHDQTEGYYAFINFLVKARRDGEIDDSVFEELIKQASASLIENEISKRVDRVLDKKFSMERWLSLL